MAKRILYSLEQIITKFARSRGPLTRQPGENCRASLQIFRNQRANLLPLAQGIRGNGCHSGQEAQGSGTRKYPAEEASGGPLFG